MKSTSARKILSALLVLCLAVLIVPILVTPASAEVAQVFTVPLAFFRDNPPKVYQYDMIPQVPEDFPYEAIGVSRDYPWHRGRQNVPIWFYEGHAIWGMTGRIVQHLIAEE